MVAENPEESAVAPGGNFHRSAFVTFAGYGKAQGSTTPWLKFPLAWLVAPLIVAFFIAMGIVGIVNTWPENLTMNVNTFIRWYWIAGGVLNGALLLTAGLYLVTDRHMSQYHRTNVHMFLWTSLMCYLVVSIRFVGYHRAYPSPDVHQIQVYTDTISILEFVVWSGVLMTAFFIRFFYSMLYPEKSIILTTWSQAKAGMAAARVAGAA